ncbi:uncharacterized protein [Hetaerina americana]|uniref:uncharacterized protein n=1 Tax=Hetaerina americana TaxID=62018 RepID=UPI003A7F5E48
MNPLPKSVLCRLCLYRSEFSIDIFDENGKHGYVAAEVIEDLLQLNVRREDGYPQWVCAKCLNKLTDFKVFKSQCHNSHETFDTEFRVVSGSRDDPFPNPRASSSKGLAEETVTDDYFPEGGGPGCVQVKVEKVDPDDCASYDEDGAEGITAEVVIKTEPLGCDETFTRAIVASEVDEEGLVSTTQDMTVGAFGGSQFERVRIHEVWGAIGDGASDGEHHRERFQHHADSYLRLQASQGMGRVQEGGLLMMEGNSRIVGMPLAGQQPPTQEEFVCPQCGKSFAYLCYMNKHIRMTHNRELCERKHECDVCKMRFAKRGNLERHAMVHKGVRSFSCERCNKAFFHHSELQGPCKQSLEGEPFHVRLLPERVLPDKLHLIEHINRHTGGNRLGAEAVGSSLCRSRTSKFTRRYTNRIRRTGARNATRPSRTASTSWVTNASTAANCLGAWSAGRRLCTSTASSNTRRCTGKTAGLSARCAGRSSTRRTT